jgi:hypothetical protein
VHTWDSLAVTASEAAGEARATTASRVGTAFPGITTMETAVSGFRDGGLWPVDRCGFTDDDIASYVVTGWSETIQLEKKGTE